MKIQNLSLTRPLQIIHSFEGLIERLGNQTGNHVKSPDISNFEERVREEIQALKESGVGGIVTNVGYDNYLEDEPSWQRFCAGLRIAVESDLRIWLYDENGYPSGSAGGKVLQKDPSLEAIGLKKMVVEPTSSPLVLKLPEPRASLYAVFGVEKNGRRERLSVEKGTNEVKTGRGMKFKVVEVYFIAPLYEGTHASRNWCSARRYINLLNPKAVSAFFRVTVSQYFQRIPADLYQKIEAVFTDEPSLMAHVLAPLPEEMVAKSGRKVPEQDPVNHSLPFFPSVPWSEELEDKFFAHHGFALAKYIYAIFDGFGIKERKIRRAFWSTVSRVYRESFAAQYATVCSALHLDLSGHLLGEETIYSHAVLHADLIKTLKCFHRPGIDVLSCNPETFFEYVLAHKAVLSASFFGSKQGLMTETSDFQQRLSGDRKGATAEEIKCILALQYLLGVRDFCFYFSWRREEYKGICDFIAFLVETGKETGDEYQPEFALYYPIELVWEWSLPSTRPLFDEESANFQPVRLKQIQQTMTDTCRSLFFSNEQFVLCGQEDVCRLKKLGIKRLVYPDIGQPEEELVRNCKASGVNLTKISAYKNTRQKSRQLRVGENVVYSRYAGFTFAVNWGHDPSYVYLPDKRDVLFPSSGRKLHKISGRVDLHPRESAVFI